MMVRIDPHLVLVGKVDPKCLPSVKEKVCVPLLWSLSYPLNLTGLMTIE